MIIPHSQLKVPSLCKKGALVEDSIFIFPSVEDMLDTVQAAPIQYGEILLLGHRNEGWFGMEDVTRDKLDGYIRHGYGDDDDSIIDWGAPFSEQLGRIEPAVAGGVVNIPLYLSGDPACMMAPIIQDRPVDSLTITVPGVFHAGVHAHAAEKRAAAIASYIPSLLDRGISTHIYGYCAVFDGAREQLFLALTKVFSTDHAFDRAEVFLGCGSPVFCRYLCLMLMQYEADKLDTTVDSKFGPYGYPVSLGAGSLNKSKSKSDLRRIVEEATARVESLLPTTHVIHMPELTDANDKDAEWHYLYVRDTIDRFLRDNGLG